MGKGRGHKKIEQSGIEKKISSNNRTLLVYLPKSLLDLGVRFNQKIVISYKAGSNPMFWEIKIKPAEQPKDDNS